MQEFDFVDGLFVYNFMRLLGEKVAGGSSGHRYLNYLSERNW